MRFSIWDTRVRDYLNFSKLHQDQWTMTASFSTFPVANVSWEDAQAFAKWLTEKEQKEGNLTSKQSYRLPKDWEWSVAVGLDEPRDGTPTDKDGEIHGVYPWGTRFPAPRGAGNYASRLDVDDFHDTSPVGSFAPNQFGLFDMGGNVWQWCDDLFSPTGTARVVRGGSWNNYEADFLLSSYRSNRKPAFRDNSVGFRLVLAEESDSKATSGLQPQATQLPPAQAQTKSSLSVPPPTFTNGLVMAFVPVAGTEVLFSIWDTRVQDYQAFARATQREWTQPYNQQGATYPAVSVSWDDAQAFCQWLTKPDRKEGRLTSAQEYRLPQDWEWSRAVGLNEKRNGTPNEKDQVIKGVYPWGNQWPPPASAGNYHSSLRVDEFPTTSPVDSFAPNQFGIYDMGGNVWQ